MGTKRIILIAFNLIIFYSAYSQQVLSLESGNKVTYHGTTAPNRDITFEDDGIIVTYKFDKAILSIDEKQKDSYYWKIEGFGISDKQGAYALPFRYDAFTLPLNNNNAIIETIDSSYVDYNYKLALAHRPSNGKNIKKANVNKTNNIINDDKFTPHSIVKASEHIQCYRGNNIINVQICPIQYNAETQTVRAYSVIKYKIKFENTNNLSSYAGISSQNIKISSEDNFLKNTTINYIQESNKHTQAKEVTINSDKTRDYLIISTNKFADAVNKFAEWKKLLGFRVHTVLKDSWTGSDDIKSAIKNVYDNCNSLYYLLIIGDHEDVPGQFSEINADDGDFSLHYTDWFYGCMDGEEDDLPDIYRGRIPVSTLEEANVVLNKIIKYEQEPPSETSFYENGINCAYFEDYNDHRILDGREERRFTLTSEEIRDYLTNLGKNIKRIYSTEFEVNPLYWNNTYFANGGSVPESIKKPNYKWTGNSDSIIKAINEGAFYIMYRGHGTEQAWEEPFFNSESIKKLNNGDKLPVIFSTACLTGMFNEDCFAEKFLKHPNGGCVAIFAASDAGYSGYDDALVEGMFDAIWPSPGLRPIFPSVNSTGNETPSPTYTLGQILDQGQIRLSETFGSPDLSISSNPINDSFCRKVNKEIFHCFGDPSMQIYTEKPSIFSNISIKREGQIIEVSTGNEPARITFYDKKIGEVKSFLSTNVSYNSDNINDIDICISAHNKIPYVDQGTLYIQNETLNGPLNISANRIVIGSSVTSEKPNGPVVFNSGEITLNAKEIIMEPSVTIKKGVKLNTIINK